jgi:hypothetical protein
MLHDRYSRKGISLVIALLIVGCFVAALAAGLPSPEPITSAALGPDWQCSRVAFVLTTCSRVARAVPVSVDAADKKPCPDPSSTSAIGRPASE